MKLFLKRIACVMVIIVFSTRSSAQKDTTIIVESDTITTTIRQKTYTQEFDSFTVALNKSRVPYGVLYDRVFPFASLVNYPANNDTTSLQYFIQAFSEWQRSRYAYTGYDSTFDHSIVSMYSDGKNYTDTIPIFVLDAYFSSIDSNAYADGRIDTTGGFLHDGTIDTTNPYLTYHTLIAAAGIPRLGLDSGKDYYLLFRPFLKVGNGSATVSAINISIGDTVYTLNSANPVARFSVNEVGELYLNVKLLLSTSETIELKQQITANKITTEDCNNSHTITLFSENGFQGYDESTPSLGVLEYKIYYGYNNNCTLKHPILILDGFDAYEDRDIKHLYNFELQYSNGGFKNFGDDLRALGYDVVIVNFPKTIVFNIAHAILGNFPKLRMGGGDYIERNAESLITLIKTLNTELGNTNPGEKLVIVGPSMGGLISRYALMQMEQNNTITHNTRLWISFDSPHHGANIPWGFQDMLRLLGKDVGNESAQNTYDNELRSVAARQMLIHQTIPEGLYFLGQNVTEYLNAFNNNEYFRGIWRSKLSNMGYPHTRRLAITNGSYNSTSYQAPGGKMFHLSATVPMGIFEVATAEPFFINTITSTLSEVKWFDKKTFKNRQYSCALKTNLIYGAIDGCKGGKLDVQGIFKDKAKAQSFSMQVKVSQMTNDISFIPTPSAIAIKNPNFDWNNSLNLSDLICNNKTPFHNIYMPEFNESHTKLTAKSVAWAIQEIQKGTYSNLTSFWDCIWELTGQTTVITATRYEYSFNEEPDPEEESIVKWHVSDNLSIVSSDMKGITIDVNDVNANTYIEAEIENPYGANKIIRKQLTVITPRQSIDRDNGQSFQVLHKDNVSIYPNPASEVWHVSVTKTTGNVSAGLYNMMGKKVWEKQNVSSLMDIENTNFSPGVYTLKMTIGNKIISYKLIK